MLSFSCLPRALATLVFDLCGELQLVRVSKEWHAWFQQAWAQLAAKLGHVSLQASAFAESARQSCVLLQVLNDEPLDPRATTRIIEQCARLPGLRRLRLVGFHFQSGIVDPDSCQGRVYTQASLKTIEFDRCRFSDGLWPLTVPLVLIRNVVGSAAMAAQTPGGVTVAMDVRPRCNKKYDQFYRRKIARWILPDSLSGEQADDNNRARVLRCDESELVLRRRLQQAGQWHSLVARLTTNTLVRMPDDTKLFFGWSHPVRTDCPEPIWREELWTEQDFPLHGRADLTDFEGKLVVSNSLVSAAEIVGVAADSSSAVGFTGWLPTPEPLSRLQYSASERAFFGIGARDSRTVWKLGPEGEVQGSRFCKALPAGVPCMLLVTKTRVHVRTRNGCWRDLSLGLDKVLGSGSELRTTRAVHEDRRRDEDESGAVLAFGEVPEPVLCACTTSSGRLVTASSSALTSGDQRSKVASEPLALAALGDHVYMLDCTHQVTRVM
jgi:hypothetical protein